MKRVIGLVFLYGAASCVYAAAALPAEKHDTKSVSSARPAPRTKIDITQLAPADEYFGPLRQSIIGINNTIRDIGRRYDVNHDIPTQTLASAELTERSIRDWEHKYPHDTQLPRTVYLLQRLYTKVLIQPARDRAQVTATWLFVDFTRSPQARQLKKTLAVEHLAPLPDPTAQEALNGALDIQHDT
ncbi:MAG: hypothetical protein IAI50_21695, partial [Candidatus Eremiobacteraeota bacterium]|nr:hypothetical protein [Candidatus Eremiobacteraeota bacterium]